MDPVNVSVKFEVRSFTRSWDNSDCIFGLGLRTPILGKGGPRGSGMVAFETTLVSSYRPSKVTFRLSLRVPEILPLFPTLPLVSPKYPHVRLGLGLWVTKSEGVGLIIRALSFQDFQAMLSWSTNVTDGWTDDMQSQYCAMHYSAKRGTTKRSLLSVIDLSCHVMSCLALTHLISWLESTEGAQTSIKAVQCLN